MNDRIQKIKYTGLLFIALSLFLLGISNNSLISCLVAIVIAFYVKKKGYHCLFSKYDEQRKNKNKYKNAEKVRAALTSKLNNEQKGL